MEFEAPEGSGSNLLYEKKHHSASALALALAVNFQTFLDACLVLLPPCSHAFKFESWLPWSESVR